MIVYYLIRVIVSIAVGIWLDEDLVPNIVAEKERKRKGSICSQAIKSTAREETSISYIGKNARIL